MSQRVKALRALQVTLSRPDKLAMAKEFETSRHPEVRGICGIMLETMEPDPRRLGALAQG